ncbi:hypothetical protein [Brucella pituitosa]|uniref:hypothetical protein n=1 Tax=Brucella pituitosa TaxID=571256 RepID=UPI000CFF7BF0|nr:hypothetical protein CQ062_23350 [Ochrobactrum sp. MYb68]
MAKVILYDEQHVEAMQAQIDRLQSELQSKDGQISYLESMRPHWAQGYSSDSIAAQAATASLSKLWQILGVNNQTEAVKKLHTLITEIRYHP